MNKLTRDRPRPQIWGGDGTVLPPRPQTRPFFRPQTRPFFRPQTRPFFKPQTKPLFIPFEEEPQMSYCPPEPIECVFPPEMLDRPEVAECEEVFVCQQPPQQAEVGSGLPPGAMARPLPRLLEEEEGMSMVQLRGQERDEDEDEVGDEVDKRKDKMIKHRVTKELLREKEKKNEIKDQVKKNMNKLTRDRPRPQIWS